MSVNFYMVLIYSLLITTGSFLLYFLYRYFIRKAAGNLPPARYIILRELKQIPGEKRIIFFIDVPEEIKIDITIQQVHGTNVMVLEEGIAYKGLIERHANLHALGNGEYYLKINSDKQEITRKFVLA